MKTLLHINHQIGVDINDNRKYANSSRKPFALRVCHNDKELDTSHFDLELCP